MLSSKAFSTVYRLIQFNEKKRIKKDRIEIKVEDL